VKPPKGKVEVQTLEIGEHTIPAHLAICPTCNVLDLHTTFDIASHPKWKATCSQNHTWEFSVEPV
jgi:hypothetical protein